MVELCLVRATGNVDLRIQVPGRSYFSIDLVLVPLRHTLWGSGSDSEEGCALVLSCCDAGVAKSDRCPVWRRRWFFISSVVDSVLNIARRWSSFASALGSVALS